MKSTSQTSARQTLLPLYAATLQKSFCNHLPFALFSPQPLISLTPQGSNRTPYLTLNLGHPCISVYLLLTVKKNKTCSLFLLCVSPPPSGMVGRFCDVVRYRGYCWVSWCASRYIRYVGPICFVVLALLTCVCGCGRCHAWFNL